MFGGVFLAVVPPERHSIFLERINELTRPTLYKDGSWMADYRRLRFTAVRPARPRPQERTYRGRLPTSRSSRSRE